MGKLHDQLNGLIDWEKFAKNEMGSPVLIHSDGKEFRYKCPFPDHEDHNPSFDFNVKEGLYICHGCGRSGDAVDLIKQLKGINEQEAYEYIKSKYAITTSLNNNNESITFNEDQYKKAIAIWNKSIKDDETLFKYLQSRRIKANKSDIGDALRIYRGYKSDVFKARKEPYIALISKIVDLNSKLVSLHLTELIEKDGIKRGERAFFPGLSINGASVHFGEPNETLIISESIEDALSIKKALPTVAVWSALSDTHLQKTLVPAHVKNVYIAIDNDDSGKKAGNNLAKRLKAEGFNVFIMSPEKYNVKDFNNVLREFGVEAILNCFSETSRIENEEEQSSMLKNQLMVLTKFSPRPIVNFLKTNYELFVDINSTLWLYDENEGVWLQDAEPFIENILRLKILPDNLLKTWHVKEIIQDLKGVLIKNEYLPQSPPELIPFNNGVYNLKTAELNPYEPEYFFTSKLPTNFSPKAESQLIEKTFEKIMDDPTVLYQLCGYTLYRAYPLQLFFILYGDGGNGKSVFTETLTAMLGSHNVSNETLKDILENRFSVAELFKKFANISGDEGYLAIKDSSKLKFLTGGDRIRAERKNKHPFKFKNFAKIIINTNQLPRTNDKTYAFFRRVALIEFKNKFEGKKADRFLIQKITSNPENLEFLAYQSVLHLHELLDKNFANFAALEKTEKIREKYEKLANPIEVFLHTYTFTCSDYIPKSSFTKVLNDWLRKNGLRELSEKKITKEMHDLGYKDGYTRTINGKTQRIWENICFIRELLNQLYNSIDKSIEVDDEGNIDEIPF